MGRKLTIEKMQEIAEAREGKCLSEEYINNATKLIWQCKEGHVWETKPLFIRRGCWCPICKKLTIEEMQEIAEAREGKCLSEEYINSATKLIWQCKEGHIYVKPRVYL